MNRQSLTLSLSIQVESFILDQEDLDNPVLKTASELLLSSAADGADLRTVDPETQARLEALLEAAGMFSSPRYCACVKLYDLYRVTACCCLQHLCVFDLEKLKCQCWSWGDLGWCILCFGENSYGDPSYTFIFQDTEKVMKWKWKCFQTIERGNIVDLFLLHVTHIMNVNKLYLGFWVKKVHVYSI